MRRLRTPTLSILYAVSVLPPRRRASTSAWRADGFSLHVQPENITSSIGMGKWKGGTFSLLVVLPYVLQPLPVYPLPEPVYSGPAQEHGYDADLRVISNGVDDVFVPHPDLKAQRQPDKIFKILMIGPSFGRKAAGFIIEAAKKEQLC